MPVYDFSSGFNALRGGLDSLGGAMQQADKQAKLASIGKLIQSGDYDNASALVAGMGDIGTAFQIKQYGIQQKAANAPGMTLDTLSGSGGASTDQSANAASGTSGGQASTTSTGGSGSLTTTRSGAEISPTLKGQVWQTPTGPVDAQAASWAVHGAESKANDYQSIGPVVERGSYAGDRAFGLHQVMGNNIGPWTKEVLGTAMTRQQFLASPEAQDKVFAAKFGEYAQQYGLAGAANKWFTGSPNPDPNRSDQYMRAGDYGNNVTTNYASLTKQMPAAAGGQVAPSRVARGGLPPMPQMVSPSGQPVTPTGQPIPNAQPPVQVASAGAMPTPDAGPVAPPSGVGGMTGTPYGSAPAAGAAPLVPQASVPPAGAAPAATTPGAPVAIPFAKYGGKSYTREQAVAQDVAEARDMDSAPEAPNTEEWDAAAKAAGVPAAAAGVSTVAAGQRQPPPGWDAQSYANFKRANPGTEPNAEDTARFQAGAGASPAVSALPPQYRPAAHGYIGRVLDPLGAPGSSDRITRLQTDIAAVAPSAKAGNATSAATLEFLTAQRKQEMDLAAKNAEQTTTMREYQLGKIDPEFAKWVSKDKDPEKQRVLEYARSNWRMYGLPDPSLVGSDPAATKKWQDYAVNELGLAKSGQTINIGPGEKKESETSGELAAKRKNEMIEAANAAPGKIARIKLLQTALASAPTGKLAGALSTMGGVALYLGVSPESLQSLGYDPTMPTTADLTQKLSAELVIGSIGAKNGGFPASNFSNASRDFVQSMFPNLLNQPGANEAVADVLIARHNHEALQRKEWIAYQKSEKADGNTPSYEEFENKFSEDHANENIFQPIIDKFDRGGYSPTGARPPVPLENIGARAPAAPAPAAAGQQAPPAPAAAPIRIPAGMTPDQIKATYGGKGGVRIILPPTPGHPNGGEGFVP